MDKEEQKKRTNKYLKTISERIKQERIKKGHSTYKMAKLLNTSHAQVNRIESGQNTGIGTLYTICYVLDINLSELVNVEDS